MDKIWKHTPYDILERIAHFADIDTRRAMGFPPRKLPLSHFDFPERQLGWGNIKIVLGHGIEVTKFHSHDSWNAYGWAFNCGDNPWNRRGVVFFTNGLVEVWNGWVDRQVSCHPDFNEDGSFKRSRPARS